MTSKFKIGDKVVYTGKLRKDLQFSIGVFTGFVTKEIFDFEGPKYLEGAVVNFGIKNNEWLQIQNLEKIKTVPPLTQNNEEQENVENEKEHHYYFKPSNNKTND